MAVHALSLHQFRSYRAAELQPQGRSVALSGPNGAGKTNLLEAVSLFTPGKGLRGAKVADIGWRPATGGPGAAFAVAARLGPADDLTQVGVGEDPLKPGRRVVRIEGETVAPGRLLDLIRLIWLTPAQDRLFIEGRAERLRFFDRLVFAEDARHAAGVAAYEQAMRERLRLLQAGEADPAWLEALEAQAVEAALGVRRRRAATLDGLQAEIEARGSGPFPQADLSLDRSHDPDDLRAALKAGRPRDGAAGRSLTGPHRTDFGARHREKGRIAAECSTGEQKALLLNLILGQAARQARDPAKPAPVLLLDEVAAHLDPLRRAALFEQLEALNLQAFLTGTDAALFDGLPASALRVRVEDGRLYPD